MFRIIVEVFGRQHSGDLLVCHFDMYMKLKAIYECLRQIVQVIVSICSKGFYANKKLIQSNSNFV